MNKKVIVEILRRIIKKNIVENAPAPSKPKEKPDVAEPPTKAPGKPKPRRPLGNPDVKPAPKAKQKVPSWLSFKSLGIKLK